MEGIQGWNLTQLAIQSRLDETGAMVLRSDDSTRCSLFYRIRRCAQSLQQAELYKYCERKILDPIFRDDFKKYIDFKAP